MRFLRRRVASLGAIARIGKGNKKMSTPNASATTHEPDSSQELLKHYRTQLQEAQHALEKERWKKSRAEAWESRELMAALREADWLGLRLLAHLRKSQMAVRALASATGQEDIDFVAATMARLLRFGAAGLQGKLFTCTPKGGDVLKNIEASADVSLTPHPDYITARG
jgi:hypothetical protein